MDFERIQPQNEGGETKVCQSCSAKMPMDANFCGKCGGKFGENNNQESGERDNEISVNEYYKEGVVDLAAILASSENRIQFNVEPGTQYNLNGLTISSDNMLANKLAEGRYLSVIDGVMTVCDFEEVKVLIDERLSNDPQILEDFKKAIDSNRAIGKPLNDVLGYIEEKFLSSGIENKSDNTEESLEINPEQNDGESGVKEYLKIQRDEAEKDLSEFVETMKADYQEDFDVESGRIIQETLELIKNGNNEDSIDTALAKGIKNIRERISNLAKQREEERIKELRRKIEQA